MKLTDHLKDKELELKELISIVDDRSLEDYLKNILDKVPFLLLSMLFFKDDLWSITFFAD
jgi:hypothetical protein